MSLLLALTLNGLLSAEASPDALPTMTVVSRRPEALTTLGLSVDALDPREDEPAATHPNELFDAVPGTWISRGSGQEHLTAIRSPVLTGAGACGAFLLLEDDGTPAQCLRGHYIFKIPALQEFCSYDIHQCHPAEKQHYCQ